ncbi:MAG: glycosyltransferase family 39 protein [Acidobacteria bacterium]|nr:glycosyltransferase family 39 protein [Acidobacteriota bacterium]
MGEADTQTIQTKWLNDRVWFVLAGLIILLAAVLRFIDLTLKPLHHDEGVNGFFLTNLVRDGVYKYDPANYHGPTLYYLTLPFVEAFGLKTIPIRLSVAIWGVLMVVLVLYLRNYLGRLGSLLAALFVALSPGMVYISRYFIHEIFFVFLSLALVVAIVFFIEKQRAGPGAIIWMTLLLYTCFMPSVVNLAATLNENLSGGETLLWVLRVLFFAIASALVFYVMRLLVTWEQGRPIYLLLAAASVALLFATKETTFITLGTMAIACFCVYIWKPIAQGEALRRSWLTVVIVIHVAIIGAALLYRGDISDAGSWFYETFLTQYQIHEPWVLYGFVFIALLIVVAWVLFVLDFRKNRESEFEEPVTLTWSNFRASLARNGNLTLILAAVATVFVYLFVLFFSSFFTHKAGVFDAFDAYRTWTKTGSKDHTQNGRLAYLRWGMKVESPILLLGVFGSVLSLLWARHRLAMFTALWGVGLLAAYTLIPYKTPWLALSFLLPLAISAGYALAQMIEGSSLGLKVSGSILALAGVALLSWQTYDLNFVRYDDEDMGYVYAHTKRGFNDLMDKVKYYADKSGKGEDAQIEIVSPDYWPMTWYLNDYKHADFYGQLIDTNSAEMIIAKKDSQDADVIKRYSGHYKYVGIYPLRPDVNLILLVRRDLADPTAQDPYKILEYETVPGYTD